MRCPNRQEQELVPETLPLCWSKAKHSSISYWFFRAAFSDPSSRERSFYLQNGSPTPETLPKCGHFLLSMYSRRLSGPTVGILPLYSMRELTSRGAQGVRRLT